MGQLQNVNNLNFDEVVMKASKPIVVDFWAEWCGPCRALAPVLEEIATEKSGQVEIVKINVDEAQELASKYGVRGIPTLLFIKNGEVKSTLMGNQPKAEIVKNIQTLIG